MPRIEAGTVWANTHMLLAPSMPFCGIKQSGICREFGRAMIEADTAIKFKSMHTARRCRPTPWRGGRHSQS